MGGDQRSAHTGAGQATCVRSLLDKLKYKTGGKSRGSPSKLLPSLLISLIHLTYKIPAELTCFTAVCSFAFGASQISNTATITLQGHLPGRKPPDTEPVQIYLTSTTVIAGTQTQIALNCKKFTIAERNQYRIRNITTGSVSRDYNPGIDLSRHTATVLPPDLSISGANSAVAVCIVFEKKEPGQSFRLTW